MLIIKYISVTIELGQQCQWLIANADSLGFYRVLYDDKSYEMIAKQLQIDHTVSGCY